MNWRKLTYFILCCIIVLSPKIREPIIEFKDIVYPQEIVIPGDWKMEELKVMVKIYFKYNGPDVIVYDHKGGISESLSVSIYCITKKGKVLPTMSDRIDRLIGRHEDSLLVGQEVGPRVLFAEGAIYCMGIDVFSLFNKEELKELREAIKKKKISRIIMTVHNYGIGWNTAGQKTEPKGWEKRSFELRVDKTIHIKVKYEK